MAVTTPLGREYVDQVVAEKIADDTSVTRAAVQAALPPLVIPPQAFSTTSGSPTIGWGVGTSGTDRISGLLFDAAAFEAAASSLMVPNDWSSCHVDLWWANVAAGAGDVRFACWLTQLADGATLGSPTVSVLVATAPAANVVKKSRLTSSPFAVASGSLVTVRVGRDAGHAADTLPNDAAVLAVLLTKAA